MGACKSKNAEQEALSHSPSRESGAVDASEIEFLESTDDMAEVQHKITKR